MSGNSTEIRNFIEMVEHQQDSITMIKVLNFLIDLCDLKN